MPSQIPQSGSSIDAFRIFPFDNFQGLPIQILRLGKVALLTEDRSEAD